MIQSPVRPANRVLPRLLVVDDHPSNIQVLHQALAGDYEVCMALGGEPALQLCRAERPDLVLLDVVMPGMGGHEVCRRLKADPATRDIPVIFVTAQGDPGQEALGLELGAADFVVKPVNAAVVRARVRTQLGLARSRSLLAATLEATADGILAIDPAGDISHMNQHFVRMWDIPPGLSGEGGGAALLAHMLQQVPQAGGARERLVAAMQQPDSQPGPVPIEFGDDRHLERQAKPLRVNGKACGHVFSFSEVTERRRAERALQQLNETLESRIVARTRDLELAMRQADAANRAKSDFLSNMSHEIRTPMNAVIGMAHLALGTEVEARRRDYLEKIHRSGQHLLGLIDNILDFAKIEAGALRLDEVDFELAAVFDSVASQTADAAQAKGLRLGFQAGPGVPATLRGDPLRIGQVLLNYVDNAIKFSHRGEVRILALALPGADGEGRLRFEVRDEGIGLNEADRAGLFRSFHQADASATREHGGTGLGLAICRQLARLMGGEVGVDSRPGQGSTFWFTARLGSAGAAAPAAARELPAVPTLPAKGSATVVVGARILVAEDNPLNQEVAVGLLEDIGAVVCTADNGRQAVELLVAEPFDCVLMDVQMPVMDGLQATRLIRANPALDRTPVIAMTANARGEDRQSCLDAGMDDFLAKPVMPAQLLDTLAKWLWRRRGAPPPGDPQVVDLSILSRFVGGDPQKVRRYARLFADSMPQVLAEIDAGLRNQDLPALADLGHRLKSSARMVGAVNFATMCQSLEELRGGGTLAQAAVLVEQIRLKSAEVCADIQKALA